LHDFLVGFTAARVRYNVQGIVSDSIDDQVVMNSALFVGEHRQGARTVGQSFNVGCANALEALNCVFA
jgi:hypothetical protein